MSTKVGEETAQRDDVPRPTQAREHGGAAATGSEFVLPEKTESRMYPSLIPARARASRCKDTVDVRETTAFDYLRFILNSTKGSRAPAGNGKVTWMDLCCGRGSILNHIPGALSNAMHRVHYYGVDNEPKHIEVCERLGRDLGLPGSLGHFHAASCDATQDLRTRFKSKRADLVTLLNVLHEIPPRGLFDLLTSAITICKGTGRIIIVDMVELPELERGAVTWSKGDIERLTRPLLKPSALPLIVSSFQKSVSVVTFEIRKSWVDLRKLEGDRALAKREFTRNVKAILRDMQAQVSKAVIRMLDDHDKIRESGKPMKEPDERPLAQLLWKHWTIAEALSQRRWP